MLLPTVTIGSSGCSIATPHLRWLYSAKSTATRAPTAQRRRVGGAVQSMSLIRYVPPVCAASPRAPAHRRAAIATSSARSAAAPPPPPPPPPPPRRPTPPPPSPRAAAASRARAQLVAVGAEGGEAVLAELGKRAMLEHAFDALPRHRAAVEGDLERRQLPTVADASAIGASAGSTRAGRARSASAGAVNPGRGGFFTGEERVVKRCAPPVGAVERACAAVGRPRQDVDAVVRVQVDSRRRTLNAAIGGSGRSVSSSQPEHVVAEVRVRAHLQRQVEARPVDEALAARRRGGGGAGHLRLEPRRSISGTVSMNDAVPLFSWRLFLPLVARLPPRASILNRGICILECGKSVWGRAQKVQRLACHITF